MTDAIIFTLEGEAVPKGRPRSSVRNGRVHIYTPTKSKNYERVVAKACSAAMTGKPMFECALRLEICIGVTIPASWSKKKKTLAAEGDLLPVSRPDLDNYEKAIVDAMNGIAFKDDSQIVTSITRKRYAETPHIAVTIRPEVGNE